MSSSFFCLDICDVLGSFTNCSRFESATFLLANMGKMKNIFFPKWNHKFAAITYVERLL